MADTASTSSRAGDLEQQLEEMLDIETLRPAGGVPRARRCSTTPRSTRRPTPTGRAGGQSRPSTLHWFKEPTEDLDDSNPPFYKWFADGTINASYNCLDRHVEAGNGDRVAYHWHGEEGETKRGHLRRAARATSSGWPTR